MTVDKPDRDATVDRLMAGALRRRSAEISSVCLDADTLAAWADHTLSGAELAAAEAHAADCARCQAMLAVMVKTAPPKTSEVALSRHMRWLGWLIPVTAAAAAVLVWAVVPRRAVDQQSVSQVNRVAESASRPPSTPPTSVPADNLSPRADAPPPSNERERRTLREPKDLEADKKAAASADANALSDTSARKADARLEKAQAPEAAAPAAAPQTAAARPFSFGAPETVIVSSNPASRWQILPGGAVRRSSDGGATWQIQNTGVSETLLGGSSPSPSVCWLVGPNGIVLLTTDGRSWQRVAFPEAVALIAVQATDAQTATVTTSDGRQFVTEDGGRTWKRSPAL